jgi:hypothetical protein
MRRLKLAMIGLLAVLLVARPAVAAVNTNVVANDSVSAPPPYRLLAEARGTNKVTTSAHAVGGTFQNFGHNVANSAKGVGHKFEGVGHKVQTGAKNVGNSIVQGWQSFKRNFTGN